MTVERGIVVAGEVLPGTERVIRDPRAWWREPSDDIYPRPQGLVIDRIVGHWSAGHPRTGPEAGRRLYEAMLARRKDSNGDGKITDEDELMDVSAHFGIGWDGMIFQLVDLKDAAIHVGRRLNRASVGVECMWPGTVTQARRLGMEPARAIKGAARGRSVQVYPPSDELLDGWRWLVQALTSTAHPLLAVPRRRGGDNAPGILEHCDSRVGKKVDAGGVLLGALGLAR